MRRQRSLPSCDMTDQRAPELPAEVLERIFSVGRPGGEPGEPLLDARQRVSAVWLMIGCLPIEAAAAAVAAAAATAATALGRATHPTIPPCPAPQLRCQLVCTAWRHALDVRRWPLWQLNLQAQDPEEEPAAAMWLDKVRPGVRHLRIELGGDGGYLDQGIHSLTDGCPAVDVVYHALQALQPINVSGACGWTCCHAEHGCSSCSLGSHMPSPTPPQEPQQLG